MIFIFNLLLFNLIFMFTFIVMLMFICIDILIFICSVSSFGLILILLYV